jgi:hypothetical protein
MNVGLLRSYLLVFITGWLVWFWLDKPAPMPDQAVPPGMYPARPPGYSPHSGSLRQGPPVREPADDSLLHELQYGVDLVKAGQYEQSFLFLWRRHSWVAAGVLALLISLLLPAIARPFARRRNRRIIAEARGSARDSGKEE